jgi:hypothetical protein
MRTSAAELLRVWPRHKTKCDLLKATIKIQINKIAVVNYKFKKGNNDIWACLVATTTQHVQPVADDVTATLRTLCCGGRARGVAANQTSPIIPYMLPPPPPPYHKTFVLISSSNIHMSGQKKSNHLLKWSQWHSKAAYYSINSENINTKTN